MNLQSPTGSFASPQADLHDIDDDLAEALDQWRLAQDPPLGVAEAIRELLRRALSSETRPARGNSDPAADFIRAFNELRAR